MIVSASEGNYSEEMRRKLNKAISDLNDLSSYEESVTYLNKVLNWNIEDASVADFIKLLEKRFS